MEPESYFEGLCYRNITPLQEAHFKLAETAMIRLIPPRGKMHKSRWMPLSLPVRCDKCLEQVWTLGGVDGALLEHKLAREPRQTL